MRVCIILFGLPGAGKTTIASLFAQNNDLIHIDSDSIMEPIMDVITSGSEPSFQCAIATLYNIVNDNLQTNCDFLFTDSMSNRESWRIAKKLREIDNVDLYFVKLHCSTEVALDRVSKRTQRSLVLNDRSRLEAIETFYEANDFSKQTIQNNTCNSADVASQTLEEMYFGWKKAKN